MTNRRNNPESILADLRDADSPNLHPVYVLTGNETLLVNEALDVLRQAAARAGYEDVQRLTLDARSDWSALAAATQSISLFGGDQLVIVHLASGRP
ncbi:MAG TPA: DNA polymerase III subunit delta, partial [Burkholderiaceae bacterium]|nr:DNA polymerase III subunit delta [Burkholderiaceae bacterium]